MEEFGEIGGSSRVLVFFFFFFFFWHSGQARYAESTILSGENHGCKFAIARAARRWVLVVIKFERGQVRLWRVLTFSCPVSLHFFVFSPADAPLRCPCGYRRIQLVDDR